MKTKVLVLLGFAMIICLSSCTEDIIVTTPQLVKSISITGQDFADGEVINSTRAAYIVDGTGFHFSWTQGDTVGIYPIGGDQVAFPISSGEGSQTAQFDGGAWALRSSYSYAAYYPFSSGNYHIDETKLPVSFIGQTQNGNASLAALDRFDYQASSATRPDADGNVFISLKHLGCFVRFQLTMPVADTYKSITLQSSKTPFVTSGTYDLSKEDIIISSTATSSTMVIGLNNVSTTDDNKVLTIYAMLAPTDLSDSEITITAAGAKYQSYTATINGKNMQAGKAYSYAATFKSGTNINGSDVEWDDNGQEIMKYEYVDLGLSVNWATFNVGAEKPEDYGDYFAWGETEPYYKAGYSQEQPQTHWKEGYAFGYNWPTYKYCYGSWETLTKYCNDSHCGNEGFTDGMTTLEAADDVAKVKWGGSWRIPTLTEFKELIDNCSWTWTTQNGVKGYKVTSNKSGYIDRFIFLPAAGLVMNNRLVNMGVEGNYWSSSTFGGYSDDASDLYISSTTHSSSGHYRAYGLSVRPVWSPGTWEGTTSISLDKGIISIELGNNINLSATLIKNGVNVYNPSNQITWSSSNNSVATVDSYGKVTTISNGKTIITASFNSVKAECEITVMSFAPTGSEQSHDYVDLGLSVKWATVNIGADKIENYGDHFAWGETSIKSSYTWDNYKFRLSGDSEDNVTFSKYNSDNSRGTVDYKTTLDMADDVANVKWGGNWRMPTQAEFIELIKNCTWRWTTQNGVNGYMVTSKKSGYIGCSIFLPVNPALEGTTVDMGVFLSHGPFNSGYYWSSSLCTYDMSSAWRLFLGLSGQNGYSGEYNSTYQFYRYLGHSVRPVCP